MSIETTINISQKNLNIIRTISCNQNKTVSNCIITIIEGLYKSEHLKERSFKRIEYQKGESDTVWKILHIYMDEGIYEFFLDLKKVFKLSFSYIVALAIQFYQNDYKKMKHDNYGLFYYFQPYRYENSLILLTIYKKPPKKNKKKITEILKLLI